MGIHLHELIERVEKNAPIFMDHLTRDQMKWQHRLFQQHATNAVCFYAGSPNDVMTFKPVVELVRLPYQDCWIEFSAEVQGIICGALCWEFEGKICGQIWTRQPETDWYLGYSFLIEEGKALIDLKPDEDVLATSTIQNTVYLVRCFLSALNCTNINLVEHSPSPKLQKARSKRGKKPLFSHWTLEIDLPRSRASGIDMGGTHASPRLHLRKGHPREYAPGKWCWVQPCAVGNKKAGMVHKDYAARYASPADPVSTV